MSVIEMDMPTMYFSRETEIVAWPIAFRCEAVPGFHMTALTSYQMLFEEVHGFYANRADNRLEIYHWVVCAEALAASYHLHGLATNRFYRICLCVLSSKAKAKPTQLRIGCIIAALPFFSPVASLV